MGAAGNDQTVAQRVGGAPGLVGCERYAAFALQRIGKTRALFSYCAKGIQME